MLRVDKGVIVYIGRFAPRKHAVAVQVVALNNIGAEKTVKSPRFVRALNLPAAEYKLNLRRNGGVQLPEPAQRTS